MILVTGGAGYIGSHTVKALKEGGFEVVIFDNLEQGHKEFIKNDLLVKGDLRNPADFLKLDNFNIDACLHFASFTAVGESVKNPGKYYGNNLVGSFNLINYLAGRNINKFILSSTSEVYGDAQYLPLDEDHSVNPTNPYGITKMMVEKILGSFETSHNLRSVILRYFNAGGASFDLTLGEWHEPEMHLIPKAILGALGKKEFKLTYSKVDTPDGSPIRDFVHVEDLVTAHILSLRHLLSGGNSKIYNLGTGKGYSVLEIIKEVERVAGATLSKERGETRLGEPAQKYASYQKIKGELGWEPKYGLKEIIETAYNWHKK